jgi:hypothetical protein
MKRKEITGRKRICGNIESNSLVMKRLEKKEKIGSKKNKETTVPKEYIESS